MDGRDRGDSGNSRGQWCSVAVSGNSGNSADSGDRWPVVVSGDRGQWTAARGQNACGANMNCPVLCGAQFM